MQRTQSIADPSLVDFYPKQVRSVVNRKKVDILKMSRGLKTPGKRNYKTHIVNMRRIAMEHTR